MPRADIVRELLDRVLAADPGFPRAAAEAIEAEIRERWGGAEVYVAKRDPGRQAAERRRLAQAVRDARATATSAAEVESAHGISRATLYRLLKAGPEDPTCR